MALVGAYRYKNPHSDFCKTLRSWIYILKLTMHKLVTGFPFNSAPLQINYCRHVQNLPPSFITQFPSVLFLLCK